MAANDPAFPQSLNSEGPFGGLTKREYAAIKIAASVLSQAQGMAIMRDDLRADAFKKVAALCFEAADALLSASGEGE